MTNLKISKNSKFFSIKGDPIIRVLFVSKTWNYFAIEILSNFLIKKFWHIARNWVHGKKEPIIYWAIWKNWRKIVLKKMEQFTILICNKFFFKFSNIFCSNFSKNQILSVFYQIDAGMPKYPIFGHLPATDTKIPHFKRKIEMGYFGIGMHIHASDLSLPQQFLGILATLVYVGHLARLYHVVRM